jgi:hypothetical protein
MVANAWTKVVFGDDLPQCEFCADPYCSLCDGHYSECRCPGPNENDKFDYRIIDGVYCAKPKQNCQELTDEIS